MSIIAGLSRRIFTQLLHYGGFCLAFVTFQAIAGQSLYVEPFTTASGAEELRNRVISELEKHGPLSVVSSASSASVILGGGGEIWVKGYRSLNPRSGRLPSDGTPIYEGYLSVELKDNTGQTFWSYLATPANASENVSKELARQIAKHVADALRQGVAVHREATPSEMKTTLEGAGATFPQPVYEKWFKNYQHEMPNVNISYHSVGSEAGIRELLAGHVDFGATDNPEAIRELAPDQQSQFLLFPSVVGAVVPVVNLPGISSEIAFTPEVLAGIYLGKIKKWNDPSLKQCNRGVALPDLDIVVVHRSDGSGTSYAWTDYLSQTNPEWKREVGAGLAPKWPTGRAAAGNDGVAKAVKELGGSIGYVEFIYALQNHISFGRVRNQQGEFVGASLESLAVAASNAVEMSDDFKASLVNSPGHGAYPIASFTWLVIPAKILNGEKRQTVQAFLKWMLGPGQRQAAALGYLALPQDVIVREKEVLAKTN